MRLVSAELYKSETLFQLTATTLFFILEIVITTAAPVNTRRPTLHLCAILRNIRQNINASMVWLTHTSYILSNKLINNISITLTTKRYLTTPYRNIQRNNAFGITLLLASGGCKLSHIKFIIIINCL